MLAGDGLVDVEVVLDVLGNLGGFYALIFQAVVRGLDVVPRQLAEALEREPETEIREEEECLRLVLVGRYLLVDHIHEDEPRLVVLRSLERKEVAAPLRDGFLAAVLGGFEPLADHAYLHHCLHVRAVFLREVLARLLDAVAAGYRELVRPASDAVDEFHNVVLLAEVEVEAVRVLLIDKAELEALADEGEAGAERYRVEAVVVGVEVGLYRPVRVEDAEVRAEPRGRLVLGAVHDDLSALPRPGLEREVVDGLRAGHRAAVPAAVRHSLREELLICVGADVVDVLVASELVVVDRKKVVGVHYLHKVRRSDRAHLALLVVEVVDALVDARAAALDGLHVHRVVLEAREVRALHYERRDVLVPEHGAAAAASGLLQTNGLAAHVVEAEVHSAPVARAGRHARRNDGYRAFVRLVLREILVKVLRHGVGVRVLERGLVNGYLVIVAVDENYDGTVGLALELQSVEAGELEERREISARVAVVGLLSRRGKEYGIALSSARILRDAAEGAARYDDFVLRVVPLGILRNRVPEQLEAEAASARELLYHILGDGALLKFVIPVLVAEPYIKRLLGIAVMNLRRFIRPFRKNLHRSVSHKNLLLLCLRGHVDNLERPGRALPRADAAGYALERLRLLVAVEEHARRRAEADAHQARGALVLAHLDDAVRVALERLRRADGDARAALRADIDIRETGEIVDLDP